ncbi:hypothetical protein ACN28I_10285 [Archangium gephyra]|uniref:hypothetical protein n=1 Tax=Archangium gephyra TaxID=48 RepID=UPI003B7C9196
MKKKVRSPSRASRNPARISVELTKSAPSRTLADFQQYLQTNLEKQSIDTMLLIIGLCKFGSEIEEFGLSTSDGITLFALAAAQQSALAIHNGEYPAIKPGADIHANIPLARYVAQQAEGIHSDEYLSAAQNTAKKAETIKLNLINTICENAIFQGDITHKLANTLILLGLSGFKGLQTDSQQVENLFSQVTGIGARDYLRILLGMYALSLHGDLAINVEKFIKNAKDKTTLRTDVLKVAAASSRKINEARANWIPEPSRAYTGKAQGSAYFARSVSANRPEVR